MKTAAQIVFRRLTSTDFYNINKARGSEARGGGQTYIDFPISTVSVADWKKFFVGQTARQQKGGLYWLFEIHNLGISEIQRIELGQRRPQTFSIRRQTLGRKNSNRVLAWHPTHGFPTPKSSNDRRGVPNLVVYLIRSTEGEYWAGWFQGKRPQFDWSVDGRLLKMFDESSGTLYLSPGIAFDQNNSIWPFRLVAAPDTQSAIRVPTSEFDPNRPTSHSAPRTEEEIVHDLLADDITPEATPQQKQILVKVLRRNQKIVAALKALYGGRCQLTGTKLTFKKADGSFYCEAHHLLPLGSGGADSPYNLIVVSPLIHRMFHFAKVSGLELKNIRDNKLEIKINGEPFTILWHPRHAEILKTVAAKVEISEPEIK